jgi:hypothetical protein
MLSVITTSEARTISAITIPIGFRRFLPDFGREVGSGAGTRGDAIGIGTEPESFGGGIHDG